MDMIFREYAQYIGSQGMKLEDYLGAIGMDFTTFRESSRPAAEKQVKTELLLSAVADVEAVEISEEELGEEYARIAEKYKLEPEKVRSAIDGEGLKQDLRNKKAMELITETGIPLPPSAPEAGQPAEEEEKAPENAD
jgi:trigger factor